MKINNSDLFFTCSLLELIGRTTRQKRSAVTALLGKKVISHIYANASVLHCEPILKTAEEFINICKIPQGDFDNTACKYAVPDFWTIGKVYARLIEDVIDRDVIDALLRVYGTPISDAIPNYNSDFFYQSRGYIKKYFISGGLPDRQPAGLARQTDNFSEQNSQNPAIRFSGFTDPWEQRRLGEIGVFTSNGVDKLSRPGEQPVYLLNYMDVYNRREVTFQTYPKLMQVTAKLSQVKSNNILSGDVFFTPTSETAEDIGHVMVVEDDLPNCVYSYHLMRFRPNNGVLYKNYPNYGFESEFLRTQMCVLAKGVQRFVISKPDFESLLIIYPTIAEQAKIGEFFRNLDRLITLHQRKYDKLLKIKKAMLEKMFPKNDPARPADSSNVPEIRFSGFTAPWKQRKLGEIGKTYSGLSGKTKEDFGHGEGRFVTYLNVFFNSVTNPVVIEPVEIDNSQNEVMQGDVFFTTSSETPEEVGMSSVWITPCPANTYLNSFCFGYRPSAKFDSYYLAYMLRSSDFRKSITFLAQGISRYNISKNRVMEIKIQMPDIHEQHKIGSFFQSLDSLITLRQRELERLKNIKKSCLEKMFV